MLGKIDGRYTKDYTILIFDKETCLAQVNILGTFCAGFQNKIFKIWKNITSFTGATQEKSLYCW